MPVRSIGITRVEDLPDHDHTVWQIKEPHRQAANMAAPGAGATKELPNTPALWLSHDGGASSRGYALLRGQPVSGCSRASGGPGCGEERRFVQPGPKVSAAVSGQH